MERGCDIMKNVHKLRPTIRYPASTTNFSNDCVTGINLSPGIHHVSETVTHCCLLVYCCGCVGRCLLPGLQKGWCAWFRLHSSASTSISTFLSFSSIFTSISNGPYQGSCRCGQREPIQHTHASCSRSKPPASPPVARPPANNSRPSKPRRAPVYATGSPRLARGHLADRNSLFRRQLVA